MKASIIISVYKNTQALHLILESLRVQTNKDFEIIISEDGEDEGMLNFVSNYNWFCPYQHLTQQDIGWRKNRALNRAVVAAKNEWLIFIDGDCIVHPRFVEMHLYYATKDPNKILLGKRVKLSPTISRKILKYDFSCIKQWWKLFIYGCSCADEGIFIPYFLNKQLKSTKHLIGCNMSFSKTAIISINGFDEDYILPAVGEDADIHWRLMRKGYEFISVRNRAIVYHIYHEKNWVDQEKNLEIMCCNQQKNQIFCKKGINQYINGK